MLSVQTNIASLTALENLRVNNEFQTKTIGRLTSGYRINSSGDDAAGLVVANQYRSDIAELTQGVRNANDGVSTLQIVDGGLNNISMMLDRMKTLATQAASGTFTGSRATLDQEYQQLIGEITRQANDIGVVSGGANSQNISVYIGGAFQGVAQNYAEAVKWYHSAAEQGEPQAQFNMGVFYEQGRVVPQNFEMAVKWYLLAAEQECAPAQCNLGLCYGTGRGVEKNEQEAIKWFIRAARQGDKTAQYNLGLYYSRNNPEAAADQGEGENEGEIEDESQPAPDAP